MNLHPNRIHGQAEQPRASRGPGAGAGPPAPGAAQQAVRGDLLG